MKAYSLERKESAIRKMMPPNNASIQALSEETGITAATLYSWRKQAKSKGLVVPGNGKNTENWSSEDKFSVVLETASLNEAELAEYCRKKGLFPEQISLWKQACVGANATADEQGHKLKEQSKKDKQRIKGLETDLRRKEKALAETAALLVLRKKAHAIWGESEDE